MEDFFQVANYGIGGQYGAHFDAADTIWPQSLSSDKAPNKMYYDTYGDRVSTINTCKKKFEFLLAGNFKMTIQFSYLL
jgi:hypothetical protein